MHRILRNRLTTIVLIALAVVFGVHLATRAGENLRIDATADDLYSLSDGTREILDRMHQEGTKPIEIRLYFAETVGNTLPRFIKDFVSYNRYLRALLKEYAAASEGKISVHFVDPLPDSDEAQDALDFGLDGKAVNQQGDLFFFGLVLQTQTGSRDVVEFLWPAEQEQVEYEITKRIHRLIWPQRKRVGVVSGLDVLSDVSNPYMAQILAAQGKTPHESWLMMKLLKEVYDLKLIDINTDHIDHQDYDLVLVVHPKALSSRAQWALDEWVQTGGNALVLVDPFALADEAPQNPQQPFSRFQYQPSSSLAPLLTAWGLERQGNRIAADLELAMNRPTSRRGASEPVVHDLHITQRTRDRTLAVDQPIFQGVTDLRFYAAGSLVPRTGDQAPKGVELTPLVTTTKSGNTLEVKAGFPGEGGLTYAELESDASRVRGQLAEGDHPITLAYKISGRLPSAFPDGATVPAEPPPAPPPGLPPGIQLPPPADAKMNKKSPVAEADRKEATVIVFADVDFIFDALAFQNSLFGTQAANDNSRLMSNAVDYLLGDRSLMAVRAKKAIRRPFITFDNIEAAAARETQARESELQAEIQSFQKQLDEKNRGLGSGNAALFQKQVQDEVEGLNERIRGAQQELREIRLARRRALEGEEAKVRFATLVLTPSLVLALGLFLFLRRRVRDTRARRTAQP